MIFVDSSYWIGLSDDRDGRHDQAVALLETHALGSLLTSSQVVGETWTFLRARHDHRTATRFLDGVESSARLRVETPGRKLEQEAWHWLRRHDERPYSFVDATSFALMRSLRVGEALAFDGDFAAAGFVELRV